NERLSLATLKESRAVHTWQQVDLARDRPQRLVVAPIGSRTAEDRIANNAFLQLMPGLRKRIERRRALGRRARNDLEQRLRLDLSNRLGPRVLALSALRLFEPSIERAVETIVNTVIRRRDEI